MAAVVVMFPSPAFADAQVRPGEIKVIEGRDSDGHRHVLILAGLRPHPWTVVARSREKTNGQPYSAWKAATHAAVKAACLAAGIRPVMFSRSNLGLAVSFGATLSKHGGEKRRTSVKSFDLRNLEKSWEDVLKGILYVDDDQVRYSGPGAAIDTTTDFICAHVWEGGPWQAAWEDYTIPEAETAQVV